MNTNGFKILDASAGSGKTYQLVKIYLKKILADSTTRGFRSLLAITFTNKAVAEMKDRILNSLYTFSKDLALTQENSMFIELTQELGLTPEALQRKAKFTLKEILHNYAFFEVATIDKFTHKIVRTFAKDLKIAQNFEVVMDTDQLLDEAIAQLYYRIGSDEQLTKTLVSFALEKVDNQKSWNVTFDLKKIGQLLFNENHFIEIEKLQNLTISNFEEVKTSLKEKITIKENGLKSLAEELLSLFEQNELEHSDFSRGSLPKFLTKVAAQDFNLSFDTQWVQNIDSLPLYPKKCEQHKQEIIDGLQPKIAEDFKKIEAGFYQIQFYTNVYKNILPLTVLNEIAKELQDISVKKRKLHIAEFNKLIASQIKDQPVPYIYERLGERYRHFFVDEFQDTSAMQWQNLIPLMANGLESLNEKGENGSVLLVGDVKQSIYRWRGGNPEQFVQLLNGDSAPFSVPVQTNRLASNYRSHKTIVDFNNSFFQHVSKYLNNQNFRSIYQSESSQEPTNDKEGYVQISFLAAEQEEIAYCECVLADIDQLKNKGHLYKDICVLARNNKHAVEVANFLSEHQIPIISNEALLLENNEEVSFVLSFFKFLLEPEERAYAFEILNYLGNKHLLGYDFILANLETLYTFLLEQHQLDCYLLTNFSVLDIAEILIAAFDLAPTSHVHLTHLLDVIMDYQEKENTDLYGFINYWNSKNNLAITVPTNLNAVSIMTIHRSKGLEFPFVLFPFATSKLNDKAKTDKLWIPDQENAIPHLEKLLVNGNKDLLNHSVSSAAILEQEYQLAELDNINVLYVALTRPVKGLFIYTDQKQKEGYGAFFESYLKEQNLWSPDKQTYQYGNIPESTTVKKKEDSSIIPYLYRSEEPPYTYSISQTIFWDDDTQSSVEKGNNLHTILEDIHTQKDIEPTIKKSIDLGLIGNAEAKAIESLLENLVSHPKLAPFFASDTIGYNEVELLDTSGQIVRLDRLVIVGKNAIVIDYKTGKESLYHQKQLQKYEAILSKMGYFVSQKILIYLNETVKPLFL
ncbi:UvrD-helicase domain-containing protein [Croceivirga radicis]|uniref:UvrD-helicase domain-containing protein n=1 Tax=Croceivirga radicis TaxID=1929488 RepID=UPI000255B569|nr:UvrD-helicase domain-containing protein [Croceivirga radicis]